jgi:hypothetical protein
MVTAAESARSQWRDRPGIRTSQGVAMGPQTLATATAKAFRLVTRPLRREVRSLVRPCVAFLLAGIVLLAGTPAPPANATTTWTRNLYVASAFMYQDPYPYDCVAASTMVMLNTIAARQKGGNGFAWTPYLVQENPDSADTRDMTSIQEFARKYDTLNSAGHGSDGHGWRNALNNYGWGPDAMRTASLRVYEDRAYTTFGSAVRAAVKAIARQSMPVGILARAGAHAQVMTGYVVTGHDPRTSNDFTVVAVYLSDVLRSAGIVNRKVGYASLRDGSLLWRFRRYRETDSPKDDPYTSGWIRSSVSPTTGPSEWYARWTIVLPIRSGLPVS